MNNYQPRNCRKQPGDCTVYHYHPQNNPAVRGGGGFNPRGSCLTRKGGGGGFNPRGSCLTRKALNKVVVSC